MIQIQDSNQLGCKFHIYPEMDDLAKSIQSIFQNKVEFKLDLIQAGYYRTDNACYGWYGSNGQIPTEEFLNNRSNFDKKYEVLDIKILNVKVETFNNIKSDIESLYVSPPGRVDPVHRIYTFNNLEKVEVSEKYGVYKKPIFDSVYTSMKEHGLIKYESDLATYKSKENYNHDFVEVRLYDTSDNCLDTFERSNYVDNYKDCADLTLHIIGTDIEKNKSAILNIIQKLN